MGDLLQCCSTLSLGKLPCDAVQTSLYIHAHTTCMTDKPGFLLSFHPCKICTVYPHTVKYQQTQQERQCLQLGSPSICWSKQAAAFFTKTWLVLLTPPNPTFSSYGFSVHLFIWRQFAKWQIKLYQKVNFFASWKDCSLQYWSLYCWLLKLKSSFPVQFGMGRMELTTPKIEISATS